MGRVDFRAGLCADSQVQHNTTILLYTLQNLSEMQLPRSTALFGTTPNPDCLQAPHGGQHSRELLRELGMNDTQINVLVEAGTVR